MGDDQSDIGPADRLARSSRAGAVSDGEQTGSAEIFGVVHGPQSLKPFTFAPREPLLQIERTQGGFVAHPKLPESEKVAVIGARACDLAEVACGESGNLRGVFLQAR